VFAIVQHKTLSRLLDGYMRLRRMKQFEKAAPYIIINTTGVQMTQSNVATTMSYTVVKVRGGGAEPLHFSC